MNQLEQDCNAEHTVLAANRDAFNYMPSSNLLIPVLEPSPAVYIDGSFTHMLNFVVTRKDRQPTCNRR